MGEKAIHGEEYEVLKQKSTPKKVARIFIFIWMIFVMTPVLSFLITQNVKIKEYLIVRSIYELHHSLMQQYQDFSSEIINKIDISKYVEKIEVPDIKLDAVSKTTTKVQQTTQVLAQLGIKQADYIEQKTNQLQKQIDLVNQQIQQKTATIQKTLQLDIQTALKKEVSEFADLQIKKQIRLTDSAYDNLIHNRFGFINNKDVTHSIYQELEKNSFSTMGKIISITNIAFLWISLGVILVAFTLLLLPIIASWWLAKKLSSNFTQCPYCRKVFLSTQGKFNFIKLLKG